MPTFEKFLDSLEIIGTQEITINNIKNKNIFNYSSLNNNKIIITKSDNNLDILNKVLNSNDEGENTIKGEIKFGIFSGDLDFYINGQKVDFEYKNMRKKFSYDNLIDCGTKYEKYSMGKNTIYYKKKY